MNKKGFTLIELILGLSLIVLIILPVFGVIINFKNKETEESNKADLINFKNKLLSEVEEDIITKGVAQVCDGYEKISLSKESNIQRIIYRDGTYADIEISISQKTITYTPNIGKPTTYVVPVKDAEIQDESYIPLAGSPEDTYFYLYDNANNAKPLINSSGDIGNILKIMIPITYNDSDYSIVITSSFIPKEKDDTGKDITCKSTYTTDTILYCQHDQKATAGGCSTDTSTK